MSNLWVIPEELGDYADSEYAYEACKTASFLLWALSGRKFSGVNTITEQYLPPRRSVDNTEFFTQSYLGGGYLGSFASLTGSLPLRRLRLRNGPVQSIVSIIDIDGSEILDENFALIDKTWIQFKRPQSIGIEVTYTFGVAPPTMGAMAARQLAIQLAKLWGGEDDCELPDRVTSVSRQGLTMTILDNQQFLDDLKTGVYQVDLFLKAVNPDKARVKAKVFSPDIPRGRRLRPQDQASGWGNGGWDMGGWDD